MIIKLLEGPMGLASALMGMGLNFYLSSEYDSWQSVPPEEQEHIRRVSASLASKSPSESKWLRGVCYAWSIKAPRFWWTEMDTYKVGTVAQSESTMRILRMGRSFEPSDFENQDVEPWMLAKLNVLLDCLRSNPRDTDLLLQIKNRLPESFLQRRVWSCSLAVMQNIWRQRRNHRLPMWHTVCDAFVEATPEWLRSGVFHE